MMNFQIHKLMKVRPVKPFNILFIIIFSAIHLLSCSDDTGNTTDNSALNTREVYEAFNIAYGEAERNVFDLYLPANRTAETKTLILIHGGGWTSGSKESMNLFKSYLKTELPEYAVVNMNYRLADENNLPFPMQIDDITSLVNFINTQQNVYTISSDIGFIGVSAGAHLSLLWSYTSDENSKTKMVCSVVGPTNLADPAYTESESAELQSYIDLFGVDATTTFLEAVSPFHQATNSAPPTLLFYGGEDPLVPSSQGADMHTKLNSLNVTNQFVFYPEEGHGWIGANLTDTTIKLKAFIQMHL